MVPTLIYLLYKNMIKRRWPITCQKLENSMPGRSSLLIAGLIIILMLTTLVLAAQQQTLQYAVMHKGSEIGWLFIQKKISSSTINYQLQSEVRVRFVFLFTGSAQEETRFENGKMVYSRLYRKMNGKVKANRCIWFNGKGYEVQRGNYKEKIELPSVTYNQHSLYFQEPVHESVMYSDSFQQFIRIENMGNGVYRLKMPDGAINFFHYKNGICCRVRIENTLHSAEIILKP